MPPGRSTLAAFVFMVSPLKHIISLESKTTVLAAPHSVPLGFLVSEGSVTPFYQWVSTFKTEMRLGGHFIENSICDFDKNYTGSVCYVKQTGMRTRLGSLTTK